MNNLKIVEIKNAYGINKISNTIIPLQSIIYSPNGTFKTSFAKTLQSISSGNNSDVMDRITGTPATINIELLDGEDNFITNNLKNKFLVYIREQNDDLNNLSNYSSELKYLATDNKIKIKLDDILNKNIDHMKKSITDKLESVNLNINYSINLLVNKNVDDLNLNDLEDIFKMVSKTEKCDLSKIDNKKLFQKAYDPIESKTFSQSASEYMKIYNNRINEELFDENFNDTNCIQFLEIVDKYSYLSKDKKRGISINNKIYYDIDELKDIFNNAIKNVSSDSEILNACNELSKSMGKTKEAQKLKKKFSSDPLLVKQLSLGRKKIILTSLKNCDLNADDYLELISEMRKKISKILQEAINNETEFDKAIKIYVERFKPSFDIKIKNKQDSITGINVPILSFKHKSHMDVELSESEMRNILSSGEITAFNIISFIVRYESIKFNNPIIILDDIIETFDYSNRYAFIEYIHELVSNDGQIIILTHNFEFYKTVTSRVPLINKFVAYSNEKSINIEKNSKINFNMEKVLKIDDISGFIFSIPYLREIKIMLMSDNNILTSCLHYKDNTSEILITDIMEEYKKLNIPTSKISSYSNENYLKTLFELADKYNSDKKFDIKSKTILSIACRILLESKIIEKNYSIISDVDSNQLSTLKNKYKDKLSTDALSLIDEVQITTPEFIHANAFMYEPLVDIDGKYLFDLYNNIKNLDRTKIWK